MKRICLVLFLLLAVPSVAFATTNSDTNGNFTLTATSEDNWFTCDDMSGSVVDATSGSPADPVVGAAVEIFRSQTDPEKGSIGDWSIRTPGGTVEYMLVCTATTDANGKFDVETKDDATSSGTPGTAREIDKFTWVFRVSGGKTAAGAAPSGNGEFTTWTF